MQSVPFFRLEIIRTRAEFKAANGGARFSTPGFTMLHRPEAGSNGVRFGFTTTKKLGKAVLRNRIRRRLRAAALAALRAKGGDLAASAKDCRAHDFVILARSAAATLPFDVLSADIARAMLTLVRRRAEKQSTVTAKKAGGEPLGPT